MPTESGEAVKDLNVGLENGVLKDFLKGYFTKREDYIELSEHVERSCRALLKRMGIPGIVSSRAKTHESLEEKLPDRAKKWDAEVKGKDDVYKKLQDLAGVRLALYFPDDVPKVAEKIMEQFKSVKEPIVRTAKREDARNPSDHLQDDSQDPLSQRDILPEEYSNGPWRPVSKDQVVHHWKHSGYRAVHLVADLTEEAGKADEKAEETDEEAKKIADEAKKIDDEVKKLDKKGKETDNEAKKTSGEIKEEINGIKHRTMKSTRSIFRHNVVSFKKVEIQITTIVIHAWSKVEHNIIYKNMFGLPENSTMNRMLDGINGLSIISELLLQELQGTFNGLHEQDEVVFTNPDVLHTWLRTNYIAKDTYWDHGLKYLQPLWTVLDSKDGKYLRQLISEYKISDRTGQAYTQGQKDLSAEIVIALSREQSAEQKMDRWLSGVEEHRSTLIHQLYKILLAINARSLMVAAVYNTAEIDEPNFNEMVDLITKPEPIQADNIKKLACFADEFLMNNQDVTHDVATALANLSFSYALQSTRPQMTELLVYGPRQRLSKFVFLSHSY